MRYRRPSATLSRTRIIPVLFIIVAIIVAWLVRHVFTLYYQQTTNVEVGGQKLEFIFFLAFVFLAINTVLSLFDKPIVVNKREQAELNKLNVVAIVPLYNEDPVFLQRCLESLISQSRKINHIYVVDDGSNAVSYKEVKRLARAKAKAANIKFTWSRTENGGKRHAQTYAASRTFKADIYLTVDSDGILDYQAVKEGLKPFVDPKVMSVAGVVMAINNKKNLLTRFTDLFFVTGQLIDRSSMSVMGSVLVNSGVLAFYRRDVIKKNMKGYLNESFFGRHVEFSDDSILTLYALMKGKAVQQKSSFAFTAMPENMNHHVRQYLRWMRGAFIRTFWRFKYLPLNSFGYWQHLISWFMMVVSLSIFLSFFVINPVVTHQLLPTLILIPILVGYGQSLFYLTVKRSDEDLKSQLTTYSTALISGLWTYFGLRVIRWYAIATCRKTGWGTREVVEVKA